MSVCLDRLIYVQTYRHIIGTVRWHRHVCAVCRRNSTCIDERQTLLCSRQTQAKVNSRGQCTHACATGSASLRALRPSILVCLARNDQSLVAVELATRDGGSGAGQLLSYFGRVASGALRLTGLQDCWLATHAQVRKQATVLVHACCDSFSPVPSPDRGGELVAKSELKCCAPVMSSRARQAKLLLN